MIRILFVLLLCLSATPVNMEALRLNELGSAAYEAGQISLAEGYFEQSLAVDNEFIEAMLNLGLARYARGNALDAILQFARVRRRSPDRLEAVNGLREIIQQAGTGSPEAIMAARSLRLIKDLADREKWPEFAGDLQSARRALLVDLGSNSPATAAIQLQELLDMQALTVAETESLVETFSRCDNEFCRVVLGVLDSGHGNLPPLEALVATGLAERLSDNSRLTRLRGRLRLLPAGDATVIALANRLQDQIRPGLDLVDEIMHLIENGSFYRAELKLKDLKRSQGPVPVWRWLQGLLTSKRGMRSGAREIMGGFDPEIVEDPLTLEGAGTLLAHIGMKDTALNCFLRGCSLYPDEPEFHLKAALLYEGAGKLDEAENHLAEAMELRPWSVRIRYFAYRLMKLRGENATADKLAAEVLARDTDGRYRSYIRLDRGANPSDMLVVESDWQLEHWLTSGTSEVMDAEAQRTLVAMAVRDSGNIRLLERLFRHFRSRKDTLHALGYELLLGMHNASLISDGSERVALFLDAGLNAEALTELGKLQKHYPRPALLSLLRARGLHAQGKRTEAVELLTALRDETTDIPVAAQARQWLSAGIPGQAAGNDDLNPRQKLARFLLLHGARALAEPLLAEGAAAGDPEAVLLLQEVLAAAGRVDDALRAMERFRKRYNDEPELLGAMGDLCHRVGSWQRGIGYMQAARKLGSLDIRRQVRLAEMFAKTGRLEDAAIEYQMILARTIPGTERGEIRTRLDQIKSQLRSRKRTP